jgi:hypothetical protein
MQIALYIALGALVVVAIAMQMWILRTSVKHGATGGVVFLRLFNIVLIIAVVALVIYALAVK